MADAIQRLLEDGNEWARLRRLGLDRAGAFSWQACARATVEAYRQAMGG
jgi:alpha-1,3-rhamnosyl/mannosyltransferase